MFVVQMSDWMAQRGREGSRRRHCKLLIQALPLSLLLLLLHVAQDPLFGHVDKLAEQIHPLHPLARVAESGHPTIPPSLAGMTLGRHS